MIKEGSIEIHYNAKLIKYDENEFYRKKMEACKGKFQENYPEHGTKAVDIIAANDSKIYLLEIKDFRNYRNENKKIISSESLASEFALKVRDTFCALGIIFLSPREDLKYFAKILFKENSSKYAYLLLERNPKDKTNEKNEKWHKKYLNELKTKIEQKLRAFPFLIDIKNAQEMDKVPGWNLKTFTN